MWAELTLPVSSIAANQNGELQRAVAQRRFSHVTHDCIRRDQPPCPMLAVSEDGVKCNW